MSRVVMVYRKNTEYERTVDEFLREFERRAGFGLETINPDSRSGTDFASVYDIVEYPTILALDDNGEELSRWAGLPLPLMNEVRAYVGGLI